jgi:hypothetical protein
MRGIAYLSGTTFLMLTILGALFKLMHWPGAGITLVVGVIGLALIALPIIAIYKFRSAN